MNTSLKEVTQFSNTNPMMNALKLLFQRLFDYDDEDVTEPGDFITTDPLDPDESTGWN